MAENKQTAVVVIPTYNESGSIGKMIEYLFTKTFPEIKNWEMLLLVVDDTSPDGTYKIVQQEQKKYKNLHLYLNPEKAGIGTAYVKGFKYAMSELKADVVFEFDGDFQHPPETIPVMLKKIDEGADFVIGSRKIEGGTNPEGWGFMRWFFSAIGGGIVARFILFFPYKSFWQVTDPTTGLRATRVKGFLDRLDLDNLISTSFAYKMQFIHDLVNIFHARVAEVPLMFQLRNADRSKIEPSTAKDILRTTILSRLRDPKVIKFLKFGTVGFVGFLVNAVTLEVFRNSNISTILASNYRQLENTSFSLLATPSAWAGALAAECAIISNYLFNNFWTFASEKVTHPIKFLMKFSQFNLTSVGAVVIQFVVIGLATLLFGDSTLVRQIALIVAIAFFIVPYNWIMYNTFIWKGKKS